MFGDDLSDLINGKNVDPESLFLDIGALFVLGAAETILIKSQFKPDYIFQGEDRHFIIKGRKKTIIPFQEMSSLGRFPSNGTTGFNYYRILLLLTDGKVIKLGTLSGKHKEMTEKIQSIEEYLEYVSGLNQQLVDPDLI